MIKLNDIPVSVIIPTYNYAQYIIQAIESILQQNYPSGKIEIIVFDDGSTDNTKNVLGKFIQNKTIEYHWQQNKGKANSTLNAIQKCGGKYVFNLDADDYFLPDKIIETVTIFEQHDNVVHVASPAKIFDQEKNILAGDENLPDQILDYVINGKNLLRFFYNNNIFFGSGSTFAARADVLKTISIPQAVDMYIDEFLVLAVLPFGSSYYIKKPLSVWRMHHSNYSGKAATFAHQKIKNERLLKSSAAVLGYLKSHNYDPSLVNIYRLKHCNRLIADKEIAGTKTFKDIVIYAKEVFFKIKPGWKILKKYQVFNRLMPLPVYLFLKKLAKQKIFLA